MLGPVLANSEEVLALKLTVKLALPLMATTSLGRSVPSSQLPASSVRWVAVAPAARLPRATALAAPPVQLALAALPLTSALTT